MKELIVTMFKDGVYGKLTHVEPKKALKGLTAENARKTLSSKSHSCWDILHHTVVWQDFTIDAIEGKDIDWKEVHKFEWPTDEEKADDASWGALVEKFLSGLDTFEKMIENSELTKPVASFGGGSEVYGFLILLQHNSYHLGQIVSIRQALGDWSSPEETS